jgi:hypothetical protein
MQRIGTQDGLFNAGDPATNTKGTVVTADWLNTHQEELAGVVEGLGGTLNPADNGQLLACLLGAFVGKGDLRLPLRFTAGGTADAITGITNPAITAYSDGLRVTTVPTGPNLTTTPTLDVGGGPVIIHKRDPSNGWTPVSRGDMNNSGPADFQYDNAHACWILLNPIPAVGPWGFRNKIINGSFDISQRGASFAIPALTATYGCLDRWAYCAGAANLITVSKNGVASPVGFTNAMRFSVAAPYTSAISYMYAAYVMESQDSTKLAGKTVTLSLYGRKGASANPTLNLFVRMGKGIDQSVGSMLTSTWTGGTEQAPLALSGLTTAWQRFQLTFAIPADVTQIGMFLNYSRAAGATDANDWFEVTGLQLEEGSVATPFESRPYTVEEDLCKRYFRKSFPRATAPAQAVGNRYGAVTYRVQVSGLAAGYSLFVPFNPPMRATPTTITTYNPDAANNKWRNTTAGDSDTAGIFNACEMGMQLTNAQVAGDLATHNCYIHYTAEAEL